MFFPRNDWAEKLIHKLIRFQVGNHDDQVDVWSLFGRMLVEKGLVIKEEVLQRIEKVRVDYEFEKYLLEKRVHKLF